MAPSEISCFARAKMATSAATTNKRVLEEFIEMYRTHPCLWQVKNKDYHDRDKKEAAYKLLIAKLREIEPDANKAIVLKKINNMRSNVRKEKKKYEESVKSGTSPDDVYYIKLWYYDLFNFLNDQCTPRESSSNLEGDNSSDVSKISVLSNVILLCSYIIINDTKAYNYLSFKSYLMYMIFLPWYTSFLIKITHEIISDNFRGV